VKETFAAVGRAFSARAEIFRAQLERHSSAALPESDDGGERVGRDIMLLEKWEEGAATPEQVSAP